MLKRNVIIIYKKSTGYESRIVLVISAWTFMTLNTTNLEPVFVFFKYSDDKDLCRAFLWCSYLIDTITSRGDY